MNRIRIAGVCIDNVEMTEALNIIETFIADKRTEHIMTPNIDHIVKLQHDVEFKAVYDSSALVLADGMPILWASRFLGTPLKEKISGSDIFPRICKLAAQNGYRLFLLGGRPGAVDKAKVVLKQWFQNIQIVGTYCPSLKFENDEVENSKIVSMICATKPDILFVGLGAPKQEKWIYKYKARYQSPVSVGIGVTFEFVAGIVSRAPIWMQKIGFEWLWRLIQEPRRLWKRYLIDDAVFFWLILKQRFRLK